MLCSKTFVNVYAVQKVTFFLDCPDCSQYVSKQASFLTQTLYEIKEERLQGMEDEVFRDLYLFSHIKQLHKGVGQHWLHKAVGIINLHWSNSSNIGYIKRPI